MPQAQVMKRIQKKISDLQKAVETREIGNHELPNMVDFVENHVLPMVCVDKNGVVLYSNGAMDQLVGDCVGKKAGDYYANRAEFMKVMDIVLSQKEVNGLPIMLKSNDGQTIRVKVYSNVNRDIDGSILNSRCTYVPY